MKDVRNDELIRLSMKPVLTPDDEARLEAYLAAQPEARAAWEEERALGRALQSLPDVPVSSNFTARVLQQLDLEGAQAERETRKTNGWFGSLWPRLSWAAAAAVLAIFGVHEFRVKQRAQIRNAVVLLSRDNAKLPSAEVLQDFDAIEQMRAASDDELLIVLK